MRCASGEYPAADIDRRKEHSPQGVLLLAGRSEVLRSLRHYLRAQRQGRITPPIAWGREALKEEALDDIS